MNNKKLIFAVSLLTVFAFAVTLNAARPSEIIDNEECLNVKYWNNCEMSGATQATFNVRPDDTSETKVVYCCGKQTCFQTSHAPTGKGMVQHEEYSFRTSDGCLALVNRMWFH